MEGFHSIKKYYLVREQDVPAFPGSVREGGEGEELSLAGGGELQP